VPLTPVHRPRLCAFVGFVLGCATFLHADPNVAVTAKAREDYTEQKFRDGKAAVETYVMMQGGYFEGHTVDRSIERTPFRRIAEYLGVQLTRQNYVPAPSIREAKLLIVVHWGTTTPRVGRQEMFGGTNLTAGPGAADIARAARDFPGGEAVDDQGYRYEPDTVQTPEANDLVAVADRLIGSVTEGNAATLLGYQEEIHQLGKRAYTDAKNDIINFHLTNERYFITLMAYDLKQLEQAQTRRRPL
jgi:hypothetical protein